MVLRKALAEVQQRSRDLVKLFVSSRYEEDLAAGLGVGKVLNMTIKDTEEDLGSFVGSQLEKDLKQALIERAQGMFLWVTLQLEYINDTDRIKTLDDIQIALRSLPATLTQSYTAIHNRIEALGTKAKSVARMTFQWLLGARRILSVAELIAAVGRSPNCSSELSPRDIIDYCCQLVIIDQSTNSFRLAHLTVREYLESLNVYCRPEISLTIAKGCLDVYLGDNGDGLGLRDYAPKYWPVHVEELESTSQRNHIEIPLVDFFTKGEHFEDWLDDLKRVLSYEKDGTWGSTIERKLDALFSPSQSPLFVISCFGFVEVLQTTAVKIQQDLNQKNQHGSAGLYLALVRAI
ncbi:hypothetical protein BO71DRAFT_15693 [Aspergillus ellipticus CBS 707.79]|uniref:GPI inositol-deacylase winged helix domain-containing protein n=1 Tax=Aspergillus ellipticus CBS 707.79 TaxID=1448320 RepID=A0A319DF44_9EURO|nr:hypothetical protein BO71DRAFT_15693 [Aspergillus ellipticus CBS 707.79]